jgi:DNA-directed RNA polymerase subunit RPC12/RpoP
MQTQVQECSNGYICMLCGKRIKQRFNLKRHLKELHLDAQYRCPPCQRMFKNKTAIYDHICRQHPDWKGVNYDNFLVPG